VFSTLSLVLLIVITAPARACPNNYVPCGSFCCPK
jgi:hypothetical protein